MRKKVNWRSRPCRSYVASSDSKTQPARAAIKKLPSEALTPLSSYAQKKQIVRHIAKNMNNCRVQRAGAEVTRSHPLHPLHGYAGAEVTRSSNHAVSEAATLQATQPRDSPRSSHGKRVVHAAGACRSAEGRRSSSVGAGASLI